MTASKHGIVLLAGLLLAGSVAVAQDVQGPPSATPQAQPAGAKYQRWFIGVDFLSSHIGADDPSEQSTPDDVFVDEVGAGAALQAGFMVSRAFMLRLYFSGASHDATDPDLDFRLAGVTIEGCYLFAAGNPFRPYLFGGLGGFNMKGDQDFYEYETTGGAITLGAGFYYYIWRHFALDFSLRGEFINWDESKANVTLPNGDRFTVSEPIKESGATGKFTLGFGFGF
jgi:hypothetical protein